MRTVSHYEILEKLGEGGMGVVWKARDTRLDRFVALKLLPVEKVQDDDRKRRFAQEAKAASALNHPNIVTIYDIDSNDGEDFIAMEFVPGKTLDQLITKKGLRLNEALKYAIQVADALAAAHAAGIVHRDLKPGNVMVSESGSVKVLDFGLAKLTERSSTSEFTRTETIAEVAPKTGEGTIVGTVSYMSPEQAEGKKVDARSDIFSFGALLYEMLTGRRAFQGDSKMSTLAAVLNRDPELGDPVAKEIPREVSKILQRCFRKDPARRAQSMADLKLALEDAKEETESGTAAAAVARPRGRMGIWAAALGVLAIAAGAGAWVLLENRTPQAALEARPLTAYPGSELWASFSPDGKQLAFSWNGEKQETYQIYVKLIGSGRPLRLTTEAAGDISPAWSPDGTSIAFVRRDANKSKIMVIPALGGSERELMVQEQTVVPANYYPIRLSWSADGRWLLVSGIDYGTKSGSLWLVSSDGGEKRQLTHPPEGNVGDFEGAFSPDSRSVAFVRYTAMQAGDIYELSLTGNFTAKGEARRLTKDNRNLGGVAWTLDGRELIFSSDRGGTRALWRLSISGSAEPIRLSVGENGYSPAISRQGNRLVYSQTISDSNVWRLNLTDLREPPTELVASTRLETSAQYSPDGKKIAFESNRAGNQEVWMCDADGTNAVQLVTIGRSGSPRWSPDSQRIVFDSNVDGNWQIYTVSAHGGRPERMTKSSASDVRPSWSQDGKWLYFASNRTGGVKSWQIWKVPSGGGAAVQVTKNGGYGPFESKDGKTLYYLKSDASPSALMKVAAEGGEESPIIVQVGGSFVQARDGIYYYGQRSLEYLDFSTGKSKAIMPVERRMGLGLSLTPDERYLLFSRVDQGGSDLMLVENFR